ncbi:hypothetical protein FJ365_02950 [Candidatus Dependentiae bacterium]|nr:hypothetical protein [Candidatus Dependentiae bacterium]
MQKNMFLNVAAVAALSLLGGCGSSEQAKQAPEGDDMAAAAVQENVQVAANEAPAEEITPEADEATVVADAATPAEEVTPDIAPEADEADKA